jgi:hypothetical protein
MCQLVRYCIIVTLTFYVYDLFKKNFVVEPAHANAEKKLNCIHFVQEFVDFVCSNVQRIFFPE